MNEALPVVIWFRQDLRLADNPALFEACKGGGAVLPIYIYDPKGEGDWSEGGASRWWLHHSLSRLSDSLVSLGSRLLILRGDSQELLLKLCRSSGANEVYWNRRYEPDIVSRDTQLKKALAAQGVHGRSFNGSLLHSPLRIANQSGKPFKVFTPFWKHIRKLQARETLAAPASLRGPDRWPKGESLAALELLPKASWDKGFYETWSPGEAGAQQQLEALVEKKIEAYSTLRDTPSEEGVSRLSPHLRFGELSPWQVWRRVRLEAGEAYLRQLGWREFSYHLLYHFPATPSTPLRAEFERFPWQPDATMLEAWRRGRTGFPLVDAGMRQLWATGWMHNRVRMVAASFLVKHLLQPWQAGAQWFWDTLVDADLANNTMGWQWVAGSGADAAPYFRVFNPTTQGERFDPEGVYTRRWVTEISKLPNKWLFRPWEAPVDLRERAGVYLGFNYPEPIISHEAGRSRALAAYQTLKRDQ